MWRIVQMKSEKKVFSEAGINDLIIGIIAVILCFGVIIIGYGFLHGMESDNHVILDMSHETYIVSFLALMLFPFLVGIFGGIEIGRYIQTEITKRKES
jgi:hypothetical protein